MVGVVFSGRNPAAKINKGIRLKGVEMHLSKLIYGILRDEKIGLVSTLPCNKLASMIRGLPDEIIHHPLNREENGVGISSGFYLTGGKPLMMIQSSGLGNSLNALMSLTKGYALPLPIIASWRGRENDKFKCHIPMGKSLPNVFKALDVPCTVIERPDDIEKIARAIRNSFAQSTPHIILITPEILEMDEDNVPTPIWGRRERVSKLIYERMFTDPELSRREAIAALSEGFDDSIVLTTIGSTCDELDAVCDRDLNFYVYGAMGQASAIGLGMAMNSTRKVLVLDGDGSLFMNPNILCEISQANPGNLTIIALDNGTLSTTGEQKTPSHDSIDLELMARSLGITNTRKASTRHEILKGLENFAEGPNFLHVIIKGGSTRGAPTRDPLELKTRFMKAALPTSRTPRSY